MIESRVIFSRALVNASTATFVLLSEEKWRITRKILETRVRTRFDWQTSRFARLGYEYMYYRIVDQN
jgi:hypothetical protein